MSATGLWETWRAVADAAPPAPALLDAASGETLSRRELSDLARRRLPAGAPPLAGRVVAFAERNTPGWFAAFLALARAGAVVLPLDAVLPPGRQRVAAAELGAHFLLKGNGLEPLTDLAPAPPPLAGACLVKLTSGTTGAARPLFFSAENMLADGRQICATMDLGPQDVNLGVVPFGHSYGLGNLVLPLIIQGTPVVCSGEMLPAALGAQISRFRATVLPTVPAVLRALAESGLASHALGSLRRVISAGAFLPPATAAAFAERFGRRVHNFYGSSETGGICFDVDGEATLTGRAVGRPLLGVRVELETDGRVRVSSPAVATPGTHLLADRGEWNAHGELRLVGRAAATVANIGGKKVDPVEIERHLRTLDGVADAWVAVRARRPDGGDDYLVAAVETALPAGAVRHALAARVPAWQVPRRLLVAPSLPRNARGKLDRARLEEWIG